MLWIREAHSLNRCHATGCPPWHFSWFPLDLCTPLWSRSLSELLLSTFTIIPDISHSNNITATTKPACNGVPCVPDALGFRGKFVCSALLLRSKYFHTFFFVSYFLLIVFLVFRYVVPLALSLSVLICWRSVWYLLFSLLCSWKRISFPVIACFR
jgi:hypothetical protein